MLKFIKKYSVILSLFSFSANAEVSVGKEPATTNVFCSNKSENWKWLKENSNYVEVSGNWVSIKKGSTGWFLLIKYFEVDGGEEKIKELQNKCINSFGESFKNAQPADTSLDRWYVFGYGNGIGASGTYYIKNDCNTCFYRKHGSFEVKYFSSKNKDLKEFIENYFEKYH